MLLGSAPGPGAGERHIEDDSDRDTTRTGSPVASMNHRNTLAEWLKL